MTSCLNCGTVVENIFCPACGQKISVGKITMHHIIHDFFHVFTHVDSGILYLIKEQFIRPGTVVKEYLEGKRKKYFNPFQYMLIGVAIVTFFTINLDLGTSLFGTLTVTGENAEMIKHNFTVLLYRYFNIILMISIPFIALYSRLFFRKSSYNYAEHLVLNTFVTGQRHLLFLLTVAFLYFFREHAQTILRIFVSVWGFYFIWTYIQFFKPKKKVWGAIKALAVCFLFLVTNALVIGLIFFLFFRSGLQK